MAEYGKLLSRIWSDIHFIALNARPQQVYCLLLSYSTRNLAGVLPLTLKRWAKCTADTTVDALIDALCSLAANDFIVIDWDTEEVLIRTFIRNDEVYRQPNLMKAARRQALHIESAALRWALHDELRRLPEHKDADETLKIANALIEGLIRPDEKGFPEGFAEGFPKPPGVGVSYVGKGNTSTCNPQPSPTPAAAALPETLDSIAATPAANLVRAVIPIEHPPAVQTTLRIRAGELLHAGTPTPDVEAALRLWLTKPHLGPNALASLVSEVIKSRAGPAVNGHPTGADAKALAWQALGRQIEAKELPQ
jgi:hypothetical protein